MARIEDENPNIKILAGSSFDTALDKRIEEYRFKWRENPVKFIVERFPIHLDIESTSVCNLKCPFCATAHEEYPRGFMSFELYKKIIDEGKESGLYSIKLNFRGEPLLHPEIAHLVSYAKRRGIVDVFFNTNATLLTDKVSKALIESGLDRLIISFEGYTKAIYERNRIGARFEDVVSNVRNLFYLKRKMNSKHPVLRLQTVDLKEFDGYLPAYEEFWSSYADEITCIDLRDETADYTKLKAEDWRCLYPWRRLCITWDGEILTCPFVNRSPSQYKWRGFGNIKDVTIQEIWNGEAMAKFREAHKRCLPHTIEPCKYCSYRGTELLKRSSI